MEVEVNKIYNMNCEVGIKILPSESIHCVVTSPPYYGLRDYGHPDQIGLEETPEQYVERLVVVFREVRRVLKKDGTLWLNLGDSYWGGKGKSSQAWSTDNQDRDTLQKSQHQITGKGETRPTDRTHKIIKPKDLIGIPWMVAFALRADGWWLRQDIIWSKPNPMPESVTDRCTKAHEYIFLLTKSAKYYYDADAIKQPVKDGTILRMSQQIENQKGSECAVGKTNGNMKAVGPGRNPRTSINTKGGNQGTGKGIPAMAINGKGVKGHSGYFDRDGNLIGGGKANKKSVWEVATKPFKEAHFATYPEELISDCILAGCPEGGVVLDPFMGSGKTAVVAKKLNRNYLGYEINPEYIKIQDKLLCKEFGLFNI